MSGISVGSLLLLVSLLNPEIEVGSLVVLSGKLPDYWYIGTVKEIINKESFTFKVLEAYNENMNGSVFYGNVTELEFVENV